MVHEGSLFEGGKTSDVLKGRPIEKTTKNINKIMGEVTKKNLKFLGRCF